jgi:hypothetical protein
MTDEAAPRQPTRPPWRRLDLSDVALIPSLKPEAWAAPVELRQGPDGAELWVLDLDREQQ